MNPLYSSYQQNRQQQNNPGFDLNAALQRMAQFIAPTGLTPEQFVRQKIQNGEMSQAQFEAFGRIADQYTGGRR